MIDPKITIINAYDESRTEKVLTIKNLIDVLEHKSQYYIGYLKENRDVNKHCEFFNNPECVSTPRLCVIYSIEIDYLYFKGKETDHVAHICGSKDLIYNSMYEIYSKITDFIVNYLKERKDQLNVEDFKLSVDEHYESVVAIEGLTESAKNIVEDLAAKCEALYVTYKTLSTKE